MMMMTMMLRMTKKIICCIEKQLRKGDTVAVVGKLMISCRQPTSSRILKWGEWERGRKVSNHPQEQLEKNLMHEFLVDTSHIYKVWYKFGVLTDPPPISSSQNIRKPKTFPISHRGKIWSRRLSPVWSFQAFCDGWLRFGAKCPLHNFEFVSRFYISAQAFKTLIVFSSGASLKKC